MTSSIVAPIEVRGLTKYFAAGTGLLPNSSRVHAVDDVTFALRPGTITALVGESGSGKSTVARLLARLYDPTAGTVLFEGKDVSRDRRRGDVLRYRTQVQMIFQDPFGSLNPVKTIRYHLTRPLKIHKTVPSERIDARLHELLETVGLTPPDKYLEKYPHQLSGGQRQRVAIARALAVRPSVLVADEPTSMLDVSIRIGILNLMLELKDRERLAFLYVTHDLASARYVADTVLVMYAGQIVEQGPAEAVLQDPLHPYTQLLLASVPDPAAGARDRIEVRKGLASAAVDPPEGCRFVGRCPLRIGVCSEVTPELVAARPAHSARCHVTAPSPAIREEAHVESTHTAVPN
jgi:peptide/nickel transport system ATP-binding protein